MEGSIADLKALGLRFGGCFINYSYVQKDDISRFYIQHTAVLIPTTQDQLRVFFFASQFQVPRLHFSKIIEKMFLVISIIV